MFILIKFRQVTVVLLSLGKTSHCKKIIQTLSDKKFNNHLQDLTQVIFNYSISINQELAGSPVNRDFKGSIFLHTEISFKWLFSREYCQKLYLTQNQKSMAELFRKPPPPKKKKLLAVNFFCQKAPP